MKCYVGLVMCVALVAVITFTSANESEEQLELEIEVLKDLLYISMLQNVEMKYEKMEAELTLSQEIESLKREISSIQKDSKINEDCCKKDGKTAEVDGGWGCYGDWTECSAECGGGSQIRSRECSSPAPAHGGAQCEGDMDEFRECNTNPCPVDGEWSGYGDWTECSAECSGGTQIRSRECSSPAPAHGGAQCEGNAEESQECNIQPCPRNGNWTCWSDWTECSAECGGGTKSRSRSCNDPSPANGGADCQGDAEETGSCNTNTCLNRCPPSHPHVYYNGQYCCKTNREKVYRPHGTKCDGSIIRVDSLCCERDDAIRCPTGFCNER